MSEVEFHFDYASPFAYLGSTQIERVAAAAGASVAWRPLLLGGLFRSLGTPDVPLLAMSEARRRYQERDLAHFAAHWGVEFAFPSRFPIRTVDALRMTLAAGCPVPLIHALFRAAWVEDRDLADPAVLRAVADSAGCDGARLLAAGSAPPLKQLLRQRTAAAEQRGVFGVPTFIVGDQLYFGQDRLDFVAAALAGAPP